ncbi:MAG: hypothetical protein M1816_004297 [Peltula sp. TS41687]|nr:MAG: hypothetical protein M1816_004297 [Peltula sp. TS41687]
MPPETTTKPPLPPPSALYLRPATEAEKRLCFIRSHVSRGGPWGAPLSVSDYLERERINEEAEANRAGQITYWVLSKTPKRVGPIDHEEKVDEDDIVASCETLRRPVIIWTREHGYNDGESAYGIASVFTHPKYRGQGAAAVLMQKLAGWVDGANAPFTALYSDLGEDFYARRGGWYAYSSRQLALKVSSQPKRDDAAPSPSRLPECQPLRREDLQELCDLDVKMLKEEYRNQKRVDRPDGKWVRVAFVPSFAQACWHFDVRDFMAKVVRGKTPLVKGGVVPNAQEPRCWLYWMHDLNLNRLVVLRLVIKEDDGKDDVRKDLTALLHAAVVEAREWNLTDVVVWNPPTALVEAAELLEPDDIERSDVYSRDSNDLPCLRWRRGEKSRDQILWEANEKFEWC